MFGKKYVSFILCALALSAPLIALGQPKPYFYKSPRPSSFEKVLPGISSYNFLIEEKSQYNFLEAYFMEELKKWITATRPGIKYGIDYTKPSPEHVYIQFKCSYNNQLARNGVWWWNASNVKVMFIVGGLDYNYEFSLPSFSVQGNNFGNHVLYNNLLSAITNHIYQFNKSSTLKLPDYRSGYDEAKLKSEWNSDGCRPIEGIYEDIASDNGHRDNKYRLALKYIDDKPCLIYLGGAYLFNDWKEGEYKAFLEQTASPGVFKAQWLMADKTFSSAYIVFEKGGMTTTISANNENSTFIKLFPSASDNISVAGSQASDWSGTGFALKNGYIVTNYHVVEGAKSIQVRGVNGNSSSDYTANVVATDKTNDLAIIKITDSRFGGFGAIPYAIKSQMVDVGEDIWVLGYPLTQVLGNEIKLTNGIISSRSGYQGDVATYQISAPVQPGNSGGPLFDPKGNVVGIVNAGVPGAENVGYAIKTSYLRNLADSYSLSSSLPSSNSISSLPLKEQVKKVNNFVFLLLCSSKSSSTSSSLKTSTTTSASSSTASSSNSSSISKPSSTTSGSTSTPSSSSASKPITTSNTGDSKAAVDFSFDSKGLSIISLNKPNLVFNNPEIRKQYTENVVINRVIVTKQNTIVEMTCRQIPGNWCSIEKGTALYANGTQYKLIKAENIPYSPDVFTFSQTKQKLSFRLYFPVIDVSNTSEINIVESNSSTWRFYGISLKN